MGRGIRFAASAALLAMLVPTLGACAGPDAIVRDAAQAASAGDRDSYIGCFTPRSQAILQAFYSAAERADSDVARLGAGQVVIGDPQPMKPNEDGTERVVVAVAEEGREPVALVVHDLSGVWRIDLIDSERVLTGLERAF